MVNGRTTKWKVEESLLGLTTEDTKESTLMIRKKVKECFTGLMEENTKENGRMASNTVSVFTLLHLEKQRKASGLKASVSLGSEKHFLVQLLLILCLYS